MPKSDRDWMGLTIFDSLKKANIGIIGVPYEGSISQEAGTSYAPSQLRQYSTFLEPYTENGVSLNNLRIVDYGNIHIDQDHPEKTQHMIGTTVLNALADNVIPVVIGGDHSISSAVIQSLNQYPDLGILWFDSHPDLMDSYSITNSRNPSKFSHACPLRRIMELPNVKPQNVIAVGIRDSIEEERAFIAEQGIDVITAREVINSDASIIARRIMGKFNSVSGIYASVDIDVLDPAFAPGTGAPVPGGLSSRDLLEIIYEMVEYRNVHQNAQSAFQLVGFDIVEISPPLDGGRITCYAGLGIMKALLSYLSLQLDNQ